MAWLKKTAGILIALFVVGGAAIGGAYATGVIEQPTAGVEDRADWGAVSEDQIELVTTIWVNNPNPLGVSVGGNVQASYELFLNGVNVAQGSKEGISIGSGNNTVNVTTELNTDTLPAWWVAFLNNNETITIRVVPSATVEAGPTTVSPDLPQENRTIFEETTPVISALSQGASNVEGRYTENVSGADLRSRVDQDLPGGQFTDGTYELGYVVRNGWATWGPVTEETTVLKFHFLVHNPSEELCMPAEPDNLGISVEMNDIEMFTAQGDETSLQNPDQFTDGTAQACELTSEGPVLAPQETKEMVFVVQMSNEKIDDWFTSHVKQGEETEIRTELQFVFTTAETTFRLPEDSKAAYTCTLQTNIAVDGQETDTNCGQVGATPGTDTGDTSTDNNQTPQTQTTSTPTDQPGTDAVTATATDTPGATPTKTPTATPSPQPPTASIDANQTDGDAPLTVSFNAKNSTDPNNDIERYVWRFGDGTGPEEGKTVTHTYRTPGEYDVELTVIDSNGNQDTVTVTITVNSESP